MANRKRVKILAVAHDDVLGLVTNMLAKPETVVLPRFKSLPADVQVESVYSDPARQCFMFIVRHESFAEVAPFAAIPVEAAQYEAIPLKVEGGALVEAPAQ